MKNKKIIIAIMIGIIGAGAFWGIQKTKKPNLNLESVFTNVSEIKDTNIEYNLNKEKVDENKVYFEVEKLGNEKIENSINLVIKEQLDLYYGKMLEKYSGKLPAVDTMRFKVYSQSADYISIGYGYKLHAPDYPMCLNVNLKTGKILTTEDFLKVKNISKETLKNKIMEECKKEDINEEESAKQWDKYNRFYITDEHINFIYEKGDFSNIDNEKGISLKL